MRFCVSAERQVLLIKHIWTILVMQLHLALLIIANKMDIRQFISAINYFI